MLVYYFLGVAITLLFLLSLPRSKSNKGLLRAVIQGRKDVNEESKSIRISWWESLKFSLWMILYPHIPNYEFIDIQTRAWGLPVWMVPLRKTALAIITDLPLAKQIMSSSTWTRHFRDDYYLFKCTWGKPYGLLFGGGEYWRQARVLTLRLLHQVKFYNPESLEARVKVEVGNLLEELERKVATDREAGGSGEATICPYHMFQECAVCLVSQACWSERLTWASEWGRKIGDAANAMNRSFNVGFGILELFPWLANFPSLSFYGDYKGASDVCVEYFMNILKERRHNGSYRTNPKDVTDLFLLEIDKQENPEIINDQNYCIIMRDLLWAGADTTSSTMEHGILHMALRPEIQIKVQEEIDQVIGPSGTPTYADRGSMTYTQAVLLEILRYATPVPATSRSPAMDSQLSNEKVSKGSLCGIVIYTIHRSEQIWDDPFEFRPERFLGPMGEIVNAEKIIPFGFGRRMCIGESVARTFLFLTFVSLLQRFKIRLSEKHPPPSLKNLRGIARSPPPYYVTLTPRC